MALNYYLTVAGLDGGSTADGHVGAFEINDYSFDVNALVNGLSGSGGAAGTATFSPLTVDLPTGSGLTSLLADAASGKVISSIELQGVIPATPTSPSETVYDLKLSNVVITKLDSDSGSGVKLSFDYSLGAISLTTTPLNPDGSLATPITASWDVARNIAGATIASPVAGSTDTGGGDAQIYYLTIDGIDGGAQEPGHEGAFLIGSYDFDVSALVSALNGSGGKATFSPLTVTFTASAGLTSLLADAASGKVISSIELQGVTSGTATSPFTTVYDLKLSNVVITNVDTGGVDGEGGLVHVSFDYSNGAVSLTTTPVEPGGSLGTAATMSWDLAQNKAGAIIASPVASSTDTGGAGARKYFLTVDGVDGGSLAAGHQGAFQLESYDFDVSALVSTLSGGGAAGKPTFAPLKVILAPGSGLTSLLADAASGKVISSIELQGVTIATPSSPSETVYDLKLSNVVITTLDTSGIDNDDGFATLSFDYSQGAVSLTTAPFNQDGSLGTPVTTSWDVAQNMAGATIASPVAGSTDTGGGGQQTYYLTVDGVDGGSQAPGHVGAFEIDDYDFDVSSVVSAIGGAGKPTFSPLTVHLARGSGLTSLLNDVAQGKVIKSVELQGATGAAGMSQTVYDLVLGNVTISEVEDDNHGDKLTFDYSAISLTTTPLNQDGSLGTPVTTSWDLAQDKAGATIASPVAGTTDTGGGAQTYYLTIDGVNGGSTVSGHLGAFEVHSYHFDVSDLAGAIGGGKATFAPLTVSVALGSGLTSFLGDVASGKLIKSIELQGVTAATPTSAGKTVYDLKLSNVVITHLGSSSSNGNGLVDLSFDYSQGAVSLTTTPINQDGSLGQPTTMAWDVVREQAGGPIASPDVRVSDTGGGGATKCFLAIDGVDGGVTTKGHVGAFAIDSYTFGVNALVSALNGGKPTFSPLMVDLVPVDATPLLADVASGEVIKSVELQGTTSKGQTVYDLKLTNVVVTAFSSGANISNGDYGDVSLSFDYSQGTVSLTTRSVSSDGELGNPSTVGWDVATNTPLTTPPSPTVTDLTTAGEKVAHGATVTVGTVTPGSPGDTLTLTELTGPAGAVTLANGVVSFAAPAGTDGNVAFSYQISDQLGDLSAVVSDTLAVDPGPSVTDSTMAGEKVAHGATVAIGTAAPGLAGDALTLTELTGPAGAVTLDNGVVSFAAPAGASGNVAFSYQISDQLGDLSTVVSDTLAVDPGPSVVDTTTAGEKVGHGATVTVGTAAPGLAGDTLTLTELTGPAGAVTLSHGVVTFAAPAGASGNVAFSYQISDQLGDASAVVSDSLAVDPGPSVTDTTTAGEKVAHGTTVEVGTVRPGLAGDTLTLTELTGPAGAVTLANGVVSFAAPADASGNVAFSYQISDQLGDVSAVVSDTLAVDPGPKAGKANVYVTAGESVDLTSLLLSQDTPGLPGDTLTLTAADTAGTRGSVSLSNGDLVYTAPARGTDMFTYTVSDQLDETASAGVNVSVVGKNASIALSGSGNIVATTGGNHFVVGGTGGNDVSLGNGNDVVSLGGGDNTVVLGGGNDLVFTGDRSAVTAAGGNDLLFAGAHSTVTVGDGNDVVAAGAGSTVNLGNGNDLVFAGANSTISFGNGHDSLSAGSNDVITLGTGRDLIAFDNAGPLGNEVVNGFGKADTLEFNHQLVASFAAVMSDAKQMAGDTVITFDPTDSVTLRGVAVASLTAKQFKFT